jgi:hypothetical protein
MALHVQEQSFFRRWLIQHFEANSNVVKTVLCSSCNGVNFYKQKKICWQASLFFTTPHPSKTKQQMLTQCKEIKFK